MTTYTIAERREGDGYDIEIVGYDGVRRTMLGFGSQEEAERWIIADARLTGFSAAGLRLSWR
jgi:hypothetical protein